MCNSSAPFIRTAVCNGFCSNDIKECCYRQWVTAKQCNLISFINGECYILKKHTAINCLCKFFYIQYLVTYFTQWLKNNPGIFAIAGFYFLNRQFFQCLLS